MCGRFANDITDFQEWTEFFEGFPWGGNTGFNISPTARVPVLSSEGGRVMEWGLIPSWSDSLEHKYSTFNARIEGVDSKPAFRHAWKHGQRCLVPVLGYYEWTTNPVSGTKQPYFVVNESGAPLVLAGLWDLVEDESFYSFTIITKPSEGELKQIHDRVPVMLSTSDAPHWLSGSIEVAEDVMKKAGGEGTRFYKVDRKVGNSRNEGPDLVTPIE